jgi:inorganic pyrophosphatase
MKKNSNSENNHNLVMFPSSKNFKINLTSTPIKGEDPLYDLIHEFSDREEEEIPNHLDERFELEEESYSSLEAFMNRSEGKKADNTIVVVQLIEKRLEAIKETKERIKFYLDEIEMFFPNRKKEK